MAQAQSTGIPLPPPYKGQNDQFPVVSIASPFCQFMHNMNNDDGIIKLRKGNDVRFASTVPGLALATYGTSYIFAMADTGANYVWYDALTGSTVNTVAGTGDTEIHTLYFNNYLFFMGDTDLTPTATGLVTYNGSAWGISTYTWPANFIPAGGDVYKNRAYFIDKGTARFGYSPVDKVLGVAITPVDYATVISQKGILYAIRPLSMTEGVTEETMQAFIFSSGEVLVFRGSYPDSGTWGLASRFQISEMIYQNTYVDAKGDTFLFTKSEILSLRNLYVSGYDVERNEGVGAAIKNRWQQIIKQITAINPTYLKYIKGVYDAANDRLVISLPFYIDPETGSYTWGLSQLIYDFGLGAWYESFQLSAAVAPTYYVYSISAAFFNGLTYSMTKNNTVAAGIPTSTVYALDVNDNYLDDDMDTVPVVGKGITYKLTSAPYPMSRFGVILNLALEIIMKSDLYATMKFKLIGDIGAQETVEQTLPAPSGVYGDIYKGVVNAGIESNIVQYEITGTSTDSDYGIEIYATNLWANPSDGIAR